MATSITPDVVPNPLSDFRRVGHNTFLFTPSTYAAKSPLIFICTWMGAAAKHIAKYTVAYRRLLPSARILLVRCELVDMFQSSQKIQGFLGPALDVVREHVNGGGEFLVQSFSNGGGTMIVEFARLWLKATGDTLPMRAQIIDSAPGKGGWMRSHAAIFISLPRNIITRLFGSLAVHFLLFLHFVFDKVTRRQNRMLTLCRLLNDPDLFDIKAPRVYLYSKKDLMVGDDEVEEHAEKAAASGRQVERVCFQHSPHAGHILEDEGKYWGAVTEAWNRGGKVEVA